MWVCTAYGMTWKANTFETLVKYVDAYAEDHNLRYVSIVADWEP